MQASSEPMLRKLTVLLVCLAYSAVSAAERPNIIVILADDLGWNDVGYHGSEIRTPRLDDLAANGVVLSQFHSQPTCTPTRAALMTGKNPQRLGIYRQFAKNANQGLPPAAQTMADHLKAGGYQTWLVGKWHLGHARQAFHPNARGFDHYYGHVTGGIGYWDHVHGGGLDWQRNGRTVREQGYSTHLLTDEAISLIEARDRTRPFFLYAAFNAPHLPNEAPAETINRYTDIENPYRRVHAAMVTELDMAVGRLIDTLAQQGVLEDTLIWFMSDNGGLNRDSGMGGYLKLAETVDDWFGDSAPITMLEFIRTNALEGGADNTPLRFGKGSIYEGGTRVPSFVYWPGLLSPREEDALITVQDVLPTLLAAVELETPTDLDGGNQWPTLTDGTTTTTNPYITMGQGGDQAYYQWPWKLIVREDATELYNLTEDPLEKRDLADDQPELVVDLNAKLESIPRAETLHIPLYRVFWDPDFFGGEEDRAPWADIISKGAD